MPLTVLPDLHNDTYPAGATRMLIERGDNTASLTKTYNIISKDVKEVAAFIKKEGTLTHGFQFVYAVADGKVVEFIKRGYFAQKDIRMMIEEGFGEFLVSWCFAGKNYLLANGEIVKATSREINPKAITKEAFRMKALFGH